MTGLRLASLLLLTAATAAAQAPAPPPQTPPPAAEAPDAATPPSNYTYVQAGRRDPFVSLVNRGVTPDRTVGGRPSGVRGLMVDEVTVRGILQNTDGWIAMVGGPDGKTYTVRAGERLMDGSVRSITPQFVLLMQDVDDPLSDTKQREVRKYLRAGDGAQ